MRNIRLLNVALLLLTLFQSVVALADVHETFGRSAADHLNEHQPAHHSDMMQVLADDIQADTSQNNTAPNNTAQNNDQNNDNLAQHDCCHCHAHAPLSLPVNDALAAATKSRSMNNLYNRTLIVRALSPHLRPPIYSGITAFISPGNRHLQSAGSSYFLFRNTA
ncbi:hypothetical protein [Thalassolituus sp. UBA2009]|uniref:hypothetical protein n=1 Tax=Thalassolituus sp. UBA2009 TaxID=1947658 RepID=UPI00257EAFEE|nr:hypothetical protein [Thalassolituus sp. UBA2009]